VLALGAAGLLLLVASDRLRQQSVESHHARVGALEQIQLDVALSHLWLEEYLTGDLVDPREIFTPIAEARALNRALLGQPAPADAAAPTEARPWTGELAPLTLTAQQQRAAELDGHLAEFSRISRQRYDGFAAGNTVGTGSVMDVRYDAVFGHVLAAGRSLAGMLELEMAAYQRRSVGVLVLVVALWSALIVGATVTLLHWERRQAAAEVELDEGRRALQRSQKLDAVGRLAGGLAHDFNNYLAAVRGHCELARMWVQDPQKTSDKLGEAVRVIDKASKLVDRLMNFGYRQPSAPEVVDPNRAVLSVERMFAAAAGERVRVELQLSDALWPVVIDPDGLHQVLLNLLINARDAMPEGGTVTIATANLPDWGEAGGIEIRVCDTGPGIAPEIRDSLFEPFLTTKAESGGFGLGLAMVLQIVEQAGGTIDCASPAEQGARFEIRLPRSDRPAPAAAAELAAIGVDLRGDESILLVDDNADYRRSIEELLGGLGYRVTSAADGRSALAACEAAGYRFDLIVSDVRMPDLDGPQLVARIAERRPTRALFLSGYSRHELERRGLDPGGAPVLHKRISPVELAATLRATIELEDWEREAADPRPDQPGPIQPGPIQPEPAPPVPVADDVR
jgi:signal transduction histidine kinase